MDSRLYIFWFKTDYSEILHISLYFYIIVQVIQSNKKQINYYTKQILFLNLNNN